jgi:hypothetical protein
VRSARRSRRRTSWCRGRGATPSARCARDCGSPRASPSVAVFWFERCGTKRCQTILCFSFWPGGKHELAGTSRTGDDALLKPLLSKLALFGSSAPNLQCPWLVRLRSNTLRQRGHSRPAASCQYRPHALQQKTCTGCTDLLDHLVGESKQRRRHDKTSHARGLRPLPRARKLAVGSPRAAQRDVLKSRFHLRCWCRTQVLASEYKSCSLTRCRHR